MDTTSSLIKDLFGHNSMYEVLEQTGYRITLMGKDLNKLLQLPEGDNENDPTHRGTLVIAYSATKVMTNMSETSSTSVIWAKGLVKTLISDAQTAVYTFLDGEGDRVRVDALYIARLRLYMIGTAGVDEFRSDPMSMSVLKLMYKNEIETLVDTEYKDVPYMPYINVHKRNYPYMPAEITAATVETPKPNNDLMTVRTAMLLGRSNTDTDGPLAGCTVMDVSISV